MAVRKSSVPIPIPVLGIQPFNQFRVDPQALFASENWISRKGIFQVRSGSTKLGGTFSSRPMGYFQYRHNDGTVRTVAGTQIGMWKFNAGAETWTNITDPLNPFTGTPTQHVVFKAFQEAGSTILMSTNEADSPKKWDGNAATYAALGGTPPKARCLAVSFSRALLGNLKSGATISPVAVDVSAYKNPESGWGGTTQTELLDDTPGEIVAMEEMGQFVCPIYKSDAVYMAIAQSASDPFSFELKQVLARNTGPASASCVAQISDSLHGILGQDGTVYIFDGVSYRGFSLAAKRYITDNMNAQTLDRSWVSYDPIWNELHVCFPEANKTDPNLIAVINMGTGEVWPFRFSTLRFSAGLKIDASTGVTIGELVGTIGQQELTIGEYAQSEPRTILGDIGGQSYKDAGSNDDGTAIAFLCETGLNALGEQNRFKEIQEVDHFFSKAPASQVVTVKVGTSNYGEDRTLSAGINVDIGNSGPYRAGHRVAGRYLSLRLEGNANQPVVWNGAQAGQVARGYR